MHSKRSNSLIKSWVYS